MFQKYVTKGVLLTDSYFEAKLEHFKSHIKYYQKLSKKSVPETVLELGTGWYPIIPLSFFLLGSKAIYTVDISGLLKYNQLEETIKKYLEYLNNNPVEEFREERISLLKRIKNDYHKYNFEEVLNLLGIAYEVKDASKLPFDNNSIDFIVSNNTFEHIYKNAIIDILKEFTRIKIDDGMMSHFIDMSDHFAHFDNKITIYNFLKFSDFAWKVIDNSVQPQNRLRISEFREIYIDLGIQIIHEENITGNESDLQSIPLSKKHQKMDKADVLVSHTYVISK